MCVLYVFISLHEFDVCTFEMIYNILRLTTRMNNLYRFYLIYKVDYSDETMQCLLFTNKV